MILALPIILIVFTIFGFLVGKLLSSQLFRLQRNIDKIAKIRKVHIHHDLCGLLLMALAFVPILSPLSPKVAVFGLGSGLFVHHITTEGLKLITKSP